MNQTLPQIGTVHLQRRRCGRALCRCRRGHLHEAYYWFWREFGRLRKRYLRASEVELVRAACAERRERERARRHAVRAARESWRALVAGVRGVEQHGG
jgi:hypothetical protein